MKARRYTLAQKDTQSPVMLEPSSRDEFVIAALPAVPAWRPALFFLSVGLTIVGLVWIGQGTGLLQSSSFMTGDPTWALIGLACVAGGVFVGWLGFRTPRG